jgi:hypothetical protein
LYCVPALTLDDSRTLNSQIVSGRCSVLCPEDVETISPKYTPAPLSSCITFCELHKQKHEDGSCMIPYRLHTMPSKESIRLQWANALNRKQVFVCSEHVLDGKPTEI